MQPAEHRVRKGMTLKIGPVILDNPVILAPMSGVTDMPFRRLVKRCGAGLVVSEMIASEAMIRANKQTMKMSTCCAEEFPMAVQLAGCEPSVMAEAARLNEDRGAAIIDINMGCPVKKVVKGDAGSALMRDLDHVDPPLSLRSLTFDRFGQLEATTRDGIVIRFGDDGDVATKLALVGPILAATQRHGRHPKAIDLRAPGTPIVLY